jgi:dTDP-4-amino-4,6-dideoxygalactose transaminase
LLSKTLAVVHGSAVSPAHVRRLTRPVRKYEEIRDQVRAALERVCDFAAFHSRRAEVEALEHEIGAFTGAATAAGCASGTDVLWLALVAALS